MIAGFDPLVLLALGFVGLLAGFVDAIAGGGGLIGVPALLSAGLPPVAALATNKMQSAIGTAVAALTFWRRGFVDFKRLGPSVLASFAGSLSGALLVKRIDPGALGIGVPVALIAVSVYFLFSPKLGDEDRAARLDFVLLLPVFAFLVGFYDGFLGPGTGSFFTIGLVTLFGLGVTRSAANTKVLNLMSNLGALALFIPSGDVAWAVAAVMALGQVAGGYIGARTGIRFGARLIKPLVVLISLALAVRLLLFG